MAHESQACAPSDTACHVCSSPSLPIERVPCAEQNIPYDATLTDSNGSPISLAQQRRIYEEEQATQDRQRKVAIGATVSVFGVLLLCAAVAAIVLARRRAVRQNEFYGSPSAYANPGLWDTRTSAQSSGGSDGKKGGAPYPYSSVPTGHRHNANGYNGGGNNKGGGSNHGSSYKGYSGDGRAKPPTAIYDTSAITGPAGADVRRRCCLCARLCTCMPTCPALAWRSL